MEIESKNTVQDDRFLIKLNERIDTNNVSAVEAEIKDELKGISPDTYIILDANDLEYISSVGLRMIIALKKTFQKMEIINVDPNPYEVFDMTGLTQIIPISKKKREINIDGLDVIGSGKTGTTYRLDDETIVKVFIKGFNPKLIEEERDIAKKAFLAGVPTAISFETVDVNGQLGIVYELIESTSYLEKIRNEPERIEENAKEFGKFLRRANSVELNPDDWISQKQFFLDLLETEKENVESFTTPEQLAKIKEIINSIPESNTFIHADAHPDNVMVLNDELLFIDMASMGYGHPIFDLMSFAGSIIAQENLYEKIPEDKFDQRLQMTWGQRNTLWRNMLKGYFNTDDEEYIDRVDKQVRARFPLRNALMMLHFFKGTDMAKTMNARLKHAIEFSLKAYDDLDEPLFF